MINTKDIPMLDRITSNKDSYKKKEYYKGYKIPIISDTMFKTMLNNTNRKQYASLLIAITLNKDYEEIYNNIEFVKDTLDNSSSSSSLNTNINLSMSFNTSLLFFSYQGKIYVDYFYLIY